MPFVSQAQHRKFRELLKDGKISQEKFDEWLGATPDLKKLPKRVGEKPGKPESTKARKPALGHAADRLVQVVHGRKKR